MSAAELLSIKELDQIVLDSLETFRAPAVAIAVVQNDQLIYQKTFGLKQIQKPEKVNEETLFSIGSLTKAFTATAIAMLVEEKKLNWDDPVVKYLPNFYLFNPYVTQNVTVKDLLSHRTGLADHDGDLLWVGNPFPRKEIFNRLRYLTPVSGFRNTFAYQNVLYVSVSELIEAVSGLTWEQFIQQKIFKPLGMNQTVPFLNSSDAANVAIPHAEIDNALVPMQWDSMQSIGPAGSIVSNLADMRKWMQFQLMLARGEDTPILKAENAKELYFPQIAVPLDPLLKSIYGDSNFVGYGLGWFLHDYQGRKEIQHDGIANGMSSFLLIIPQEKLALVVLSNLKESAMPHAIAYKIMDTLFGPTQHQWDKELSELLKNVKRKENEKEQESLLKRIPNAAASHSLSDYVGKYNNALYGDVIIYEEPTGLKAKVIAGIGSLEHWHFDTFLFIPDDKTLLKQYITFSLNQDGNVDALKVYPILTNIEFKRLIENN